MAISMGLSSATLRKKEEEEDEKKKGKGKKQEKGKKGTTQKGAETASMAATGAAGLMGGPAGMIGAGLQIGAGLVESNQAKKAAARAENRPERRRLAKGVETFKERKRSKEMALATLSQAVFDWASAIR